MFFYIQENIEEHITTIRSEAERVINHTLPVCHPLTVIMGVQHYRSYEAFLFKKNLNASKPSEYPPQVEECLKV